MQAMTIPSVTLNNSVEMPILGFGVFQIPPDETEQAVSTASRSATGCSTPPPRTGTRKRSAARSGPAASPATRSS